MNKVAVVIPTHCRPEIIKLTLGTLLRTLGRTFDLNIHLGVHSNYSDYCCDLSLFEDLRRIAHIHLIDEIDWFAHNDDLLRYSKMHSKNLENLFRQIRYYEFDYVLVLDNDVYIKQDFITPLLQDSPDLAGILFKDKSDSYEFTSSPPYNERLVAMPKICPWHLLISQKLYRKIMEDTGVIYPDIVRGAPALTYTQGLPAFIDTFGKVFHSLPSWGMTSKIVSTSQFEEWALHYFSTSFNMAAWGNRSHPGVGEAHITRIVETYSKEFPNGLFCYPMD